MRILISRRIRRRYLKRKTESSLKEKKTMRDILMVSKGLIMLTGLIVRISLGRYLKRKIIKRRFRVRFDRKT